MDKYTRELTEAEKELATYKKQSYNDLDILPKVDEKFYVSDIDINQLDQENLELKLAVSTKFSDEDKEDFEIIQKEFDDLNKRIAVSDIVATCRIVDQSGELLQYLTELLAAHRNLNKLSDGELIHRQSELRYKIRKFLDKKVK